MAGASASCASDDPEPPAVVDPSGAAVTELPGLPPPTGDPVLPALETAAPAPGSVVQVPGPFDDRFTIDRLRLEAGTVRGRLTVVSDVSELLELEVQVGFYDAAGRLLGSASHVHHHDESEGHAETGPPSQGESFVVRAPRRFAAAVSSAAVGVPVLVNE